MLSTINQFKNLLISLTSHAAISFPFGAISTISLFRNHELLATCNWNKKGQKKNPQRYFQLFNGMKGPWCEILNPSHDLQIKEVEISGNDDNGNPFSMYCPIEFLIPSEKVFTN